MQEIICPNCGKAFSVDEQSYAQILSQVRSKEFEQEIHARLESLEKEQESKIALINEKAESKIKDLQAKIDASDTATKLAVNEALYELEREKDAQIQKLQTQLNSFEATKKVHILEIETAAEQKQLKLQHDLETLKNQNELATKSLQEKFESEIQLREGEIERLQDFKARLSTKMVGETLEQHCQTEFDRIRAIAFPRASFEKDNDARGGSKGDFIFRDYDESGIELISIMFEMKNENETTATKKKNEHFFKELDKDRNEKNCEYAILVSMLEAEDELYNTGIVDVSHRYPKMFVIRPQFFIQIISLLRNASLNSLEYKRELEKARAQNIDINNFEDELLDFKKIFGTHYTNAKNRFDDAVDRIDKAIDSLKKVKENLTLSSGHLDKARNKADDLTIQELTKNNPTMQEKFANASRREITE